MPSSVAVVLQREGAKLQVLSATDPWRTPFGKAAMKRALNSGHDCVSHSH